MSQAKIAHYQLQSRLGKGAMGVVFRARDERLERDVAIKLLQVNLESDEAADYAARLLQEARSAARLNHPGIITVYDCGEWRSKSYLAMELVHGITLKDLLEKRGQLSIRQVVSIARQMFAALGHAHRHKVIHRDIKPGNLMLTKEGRLKITDFGIAQLPASDLTRTGTILGSPRYMSPEQLAGKKLDGRADLYSAGVVLYQCLTGKAPFDGETTMNIVYQVLHTTPPAPHELRPEVPRVLSDLVMRCIDKHADQRFSSLDAALAALLGGDVSPQRAELAPEDPTEAFHTSDAAFEAKTVATASPILPWLSQTGSVLAWLVRHCLVGLRFLGRHLWYCTQALARALQRWTPLLWNGLTRYAQFLRPYGKTALQATRSAFRRLPQRVQLLIVLLAAAGALWAIWPSQPAVELELSPAVSNSVEDSNGDANQLQAEHQQRSQLLESMAEQQALAQGEEGTNQVQAKQETAPIDQFDADAPRAEPESIDQQANVSGSLKQAGQEIKQDVKGVFNCILGQGNCPKTNTQANHQTDQRRP
ncbi:serine/threonine protein kinase [Chitinibacter sp. SCUT-21]|uniref:serine/threonine-protein kinase n=1 Tax=Chitinibacter sp. SCUT-21 TaxID=2970891 RepID=UPI0035A5C4A2